MRVRRRIFDIFLFGTPIIVRRLKLKLEAVQRSPDGLCLIGLRFFSGRETRSLADPQPVPVAVRMGGKGEENVLSKILCQVYLLGAVEFYLARKVWDANRILESFKAGDALHVKRAFEATGGKQASIAQANLQGVF